MNALQKTLAIIAFLILTTQTVRHAYLLWLEPRTSVLDKYEQPLRGQIADAASLAELVGRYDPVRKEADKARHEREELLKTTKEPPPYINELTDEPYKSEQMLHDAIVDWEQKSKQIREIRFYWSAGMAFFLLGLFIYRRSGRWLGFTLVIAGFSEIIYWTSPTFLGAGSTHEFDRLLVNKLAFSVVSLVALAVAIWFLDIFVDKGSKEQPEA